MVLEILKQQMQKLSQDISEAMDAPLKNGWMDKATHEQYKKDMNLYSKLLVLGRKKEADSVLKKIIKKYDTPKQDGV